MIARALSILLLGWVAGFVLFVVTLQRRPGDQRTDAIVVLTGGSGRIERGLALLAAGKAKRMLISGVDRTVRARELAMHYPGQARLFACCIDLGREAVDTRSNAEETARWMVAHQYHSVRLVTTDWHMPRGRFELAHVLTRAEAGAVIVPDAVRSEPGLGALVREYNKYLLRRAAVMAGK